MRSRDRSSVRGPKILRLDSIWFGCVGSFAFAAQLSARARVLLLCGSTFPGTMQTEGPGLLTCAAVASMPLVVAALRQRHSETVRALECRVCGRLLGRSHYSNSQWRRHRDRPQCIACTAVQYRKEGNRVHHDDDDGDEDEEEYEHDATGANPRARERNCKLLRTAQAPYWGKRLRPNNWGYATHLDALWGKACFADIVRLGVFPDAKDASEAMCALRAATAFGNIGLGDKGTAGSGSGGSGGCVSQGEDENKSAPENRSGMRAHNRACRAEGVACVCIGDGATPRCAALVSYLTKWQAFCVDPGLRVEFCGEEPKGIKRLDGSRSTLEAWLGSGPGEGPEGPAHAVIRNAAAKSWTRSTACSTMCTSEIGSGGVEPFRWHHLVLLCVHSHHRFVGDASIERVRAAFGSPDTCLVALPCCHRFHPHKDLGGAEPVMAYDDTAVFSACRRVLVYNWDRAQQPRGPPVPRPVAPADGTPGEAPSATEGEQVQMKPTAAGLFLTGPEEQDFSLATVDGTKDDFDQRYKLGKQLGQGHYSIVKEGVHCETGEAFAVKIMKKSKMADEDCAALKQEIALLKSLRHPNIIALHEHFEDAAHYYLVTEKCAGGEIFDRIVEREFYSELKARNVARALLQAIEYCHDHDVVHRDLKPENLLLTSLDDDESFKIADFGFGKRSVGLASRGDHNNAYGLSTQCGTPGYIAPEILEGQRYGKGVDIWSAGIITYILLCGYPPFHDDDLKQLFRKIRKGEFEFDSPFWDDVSNAARNFVRRMLVVQQGKRATARELLQDPWILDDAVSDANNELAIKGLRLWNAKRKFRAAVKTIVATNRIRKLTAAFGASAKGMSAVSPEKAKATGED